MWCSLALVGSAIGQRLEVLLEVVGGGGARAERPVVAHASLAPPAFLCCWCLLLLARPQAGQNRLLAPALAVCLSPSVSGRLSRFCQVLSLEDRKLRLLDLPVSCLVPPSRPPSMFLPAIVLVLLIAASGCAQQLTAGVELGCFVSPTATSVLSDYQTTLSPNSITLCQSACSQKSYRFSGVSNGTTCVCGDNFIYGAMIGNDMLTSGLSVLDSDCKNPCSGNSTQSCGTSSRIYVSLSFPPGCYIDGTVSHILSDYTATPAESVQMTMHSCQAFCQDKNYIYAGAESGGTCMCGNSVNYGGTGAGSPTPAGSATAASDCNVLCTGNTTQTCGGSYRMAISLTGVAPNITISNSTIDLPMLTGSSASLSAPSYIGIGVGVACGVTLIAVACCIRARRKRRSSQAPDFPVLSEKHLTIVPNEKLTKDSSSTVTAVSSSGQTPTSESSNSTASLIRNDKSSSTSKSSRASNANYLVTHRPRPPVVLTARPVPSSPPNVEHNTIDFARAGSRASIHSNHSRPMSIVSVSASGGNDTKQALRHMSIYDYVHGPGASVASTNPLSNHSRNSLMILPSPVVASPEDGRPRAYSTPLPSVSVGSLDLDFKLDSLLSMGRTMSAQSHGLRSDVSSIGSKRRSIATRVPAQPDEVPISRVGEVFEITAEFDDGWGLARSLNTGQTGAVPLNFLENLDETETGMAASAGPTIA
ncbi:uncharacterized protein BJ171DRAFT_498663 [Polychytrium aggregatum]|uniref:uncharacterized protein n=1 Tax=Polychytrium aggregatum TaxID=110093 RepID=UPI0022FE0D9C|nr:uncharacterized protein BJ171DRAFT_498663 [Polychytrium aggregatum]KAI9206091.1 hypothetical protein BJ171DRAFT_498663 [Polychytrium aggregatum]